jgi:hypothetical protein
LTSPAAVQMIRLWETAARIGELGSVKRSESAADLGDGWVGERRPITEDNRRHGQIAVIDVSDDLSPIGMIFDVDLVEFDTGAIQLGFEPYAVATPTGGENSWLVCTRQIHSHVMHNRALRPHISARRVAFLTVLCESFAQMDADRLAFLLADQLA